MWWRGPAGDTQSLSVVFSLSRCRDNRAWLVFAPVPFFALSVLFKTSVHPAIRSAVYLQHRNPCLNHCPHTSPASCPTFS